MTEINHKQIDNSNNNNYEVEEDIANKRVFKGNKNIVIAFISVAISVLPIIYVSRVLDNIGIFIPNVSFLSLMLALLIILGFMLLPIKPIKKVEDKSKIPWYDFMIILLSIIAPIYNFFNWGTNAYRYIYYDFYLFEIVIGFFTIIAVLELTRRAIGLAMPLVTAIFLLHMFFGYKLTGFLKTPKITIVNGVANLIYYDTGIFGVALQVAATVIILFLIFSQFMIKLGGTNFLFNVSLSIFGHVRGGPAKVAAVSSALMGMFSGSTTANIASTGVFTIPMMKRIGYKPEFAAAVEAVASNGGQIMPPVMGMVAFVMAQWLGIDYSQIVIMAIIPAFLYFFALFIIIDSKACLEDIKGIPKEKCPIFINTIKEGWFYLIPIISLIFFIVVLKYSPEFSILYSIVAIFLAKGIKKILKIITREDKVFSFLIIAKNTYKLILTVLKNAGTLMLTPGIVTACCGIIIGSLSVTQLGVTLARYAVEFASQNVIFLLLIAAFTCFVLGMGMSSLPAYIMTVIVVAPALLDFGIPPIATHFFVFWFSIISFITPPVAVGAYVAAGIANANGYETGIESMKLGFVEFILPFIFVLNPGLLMQNTIDVVLIKFLFAIIAVAFISFGISNYFFGKLNTIKRFLFILGGLLIISLNYRIVILGILLSATAVILQVIRMRKNKINL
jgi:TRAP transporter 4TM/12TM fusion protein